MPEELPGIPKDENGEPIFLLLPPAIRAKYEQRMIALEQAWRATRDPAYFREANTWAHTHRQPVPRWLYEAGDAIAAGRRTKRHAEQYQDAQRHLTRYLLVNTLRAEGLTLDEALDRASEHLKQIGAAASRSTIADSYERLKRERQTKQFARYQPLRKSRFGTVGGQ